MSTKIYFKAISIFLLTIITLPAMAGMPWPGGSWNRSCKDAWIRDVGQNYGMVYANCKQKNGRYKFTTSPVMSKTNGICGGQKHGHSLTNSDGNLRCGG